MGMFIRVGRGVQRKSLGRQVGGDVTFVFYYQEKVAVQGFWSTFPVFYFVTIF